MNIPANELHFTRTFDAPRELVWKAWTDPKQIVQWWGPKGFTTTTTEKMDVVKGGTWGFVMHGPDGRDYDNRVVYDEVVRGEKLAYHHSDADEDEPVAFHVTVLFSEQDGKTTLAMKMVFPTQKDRDDAIKQYGAEEGAKETLNRLAQHLHHMR